MSILLPIRIYSLVVPHIDKVHIVMSNHFDCGFDGISEPGFSVNVVNTYFDTYVFNTPYFPSSFGSSLTIDIHP